MYSKRKLLLDSLKLFDLFLMLGSFAFSMLVVSSGLRFSSFQELLAMRTKLSNFAIFLGFMVSWHIIFSLFELYHSKRLSSAHREAIDVAKATTAGAAVLLVGALVFNIRLVTPVFLVFFWAGHDVKHHDEPVSDEVGVNAGQAEGQELEKRGDSRRQ